MCRLRLVLTAISRLPWLLSCAAPPRELPAVAPGEFLPGDYVNVRVPNSKGWHWVESSSKGMGFKKHGHAPGESLGAQLLIFDLEPTETPEQFVALIKQAIEHDTDPKRFHVLQSSIDYTSERGYPCARYHALADDKHARTSANTREQLVLEWHGLYCRHPVRTDRGFAAVYSHRGRGKYQGLDAEAQDFISGVQVP